jgi:hypothetical protein
MLRATRMRLDGQAERIIRVADELLMAATGLGPMDDMDLVIRIERDVSGTMVETLYASRAPAGTDRVPVGSFLMIGSDRCGVYDIVHEITQIMVDMVGGEGDAERPIFIWHLRALLQRLVASGTLNAIEAIAAAEGVGHPSGRVRILSDDAQVVAACWRRTVPRTGGGRPWGRSRCSPTWAHYPRGPSPCSARRAAGAGPWQNQGGGGGLYEDEELLMIGTPLAHA